MPTPRTPSTSTSNELAAMRIVLENIDRKTDSIDKISTDIALMKQQYQEINERVCKLVGDVYGNGKPGLKTEVKELKDWKGIISKVLWIIITPLVTFSVAVGIYLIITFGNQVMH